MYSGIPTMGVGIGWRREIAQEIMLHKEHIEWCEVIAEHYINVTADKLEQLSNLARTFPVVPHGIDLSIGTDRPVETGYLESLAALVLPRETAARIGRNGLGQLLPCKYVYPRP